MRKRAEVFPTYVMRELSVTLSGKFLSKEFKKVNSNHMGIIDVTHVGK